MIARRPILPFPLSLLILPALSLSLWTAPKLHGRQTNVFNPPHAPSPPVFLHLRQRPLVCLATPRPPAPPLRTHSAAPFLYLHTVHIDVCSCLRTAGMSANMHAHGGGGGRRRRRRAAAAGYRRTRRFSLTPGAPLARRDSQVEGGPGQADLAVVLDRKVSRQRGLRCCSLVRAGPLLNVARKAAHQPAVQHLFSS